MSSSWIEIDTFALIQNVRLVRKLIGDMPLWAVVKSNAYGHDLGLASEAFWRGGVDGLIVADIDDAKRLSDERYKLPVLIFHPVPDDLLPLAATNGWHMAVPSMAFYHNVEHFASMRQRDLTIHLELETGMHRTGLSAIDIENIISKNDRPDSHVKIAGLFTHLYAPTSPSVSRGQIQQMEELRFTLQRKNLTIPTTHVFASKGLGL